MTQHIEKLLTEETSKNTKEDTIEDSQQLSEKCDTVIAKIKIKKAKK